MPVSTTEHTDLLVTAGTGWPGRETALELRQ